MSHIKQCLCQIKLDSQTATQTASRLAVRDRKHEACIPQHKTGKDASRPGLAASYRPEAGGIPQNTDQRTGTSQQSHPRQSLAVSFSSRFQ